MAFIVTLGLFHVDFFRSFRVGSVLCKLSLCHGQKLSVKVVLTTLIVITLIIALCDQTASGLLKPMIGRMRPSNPDNPISPMVHIVQGYRGGAYGFPSSHAANAWGMAFLQGILCGEVN